MPEIDCKSSTVLIYKVETGAVDSLASMEIVEAGKRLPECLLWQLQEDFYTNAGLGAWSAIPFYPTSNVFFAELYADLVLAFIEDLGDALDPGQPLYLLELAAGSGTFAFYFLKALKRKLARREIFQALKLRYVMTDFAESIVEGWRRNDQLMAFSESGLLDFAVFRPEEQTDLHLTQANSKLVAGCNPVIAIASYFFDSIRQNQFRIENHQLLEARLTFSRPLEFSGQPVGIAQLIKTEEFTPYVEKYEDARLNRLLDFYRETFEQGSVIFPEGGFNCIRNLLELSGNNLLLLLADKGFSTLDYMRGYKSQDYLIHEGAFSYMVNFDAVARYFEEAGGFGWRDAGNTSILNVLAGGVLSGFSGKLERFRACFEESLLRKDTANAVNLSRRFIHPERHDATSLMRAGMAMVRLGNYDPVVFCDAAPAVFEGIGETLLVTDYRNLLEVLARVRENIFGRDATHVYPELQRIYFRLGHYADCMATAEESIARLGENISALLHLAACCEQEGQPEKAAALRAQAEALKLTLKS